MSKSIGAMSINIGKKILEILLTPTGALSRKIGLKSQHYKTLYGERNPSDFLNYRSYIRNEGDKYGIYNMANYRKSFILEVSPGPYLGEALENTIRGLLSALTIDDIAIQFTTYASSNIQDYISAYEKHHDNMEHLNIDGKRAIRALSKKKIEYYEKWTKESMVGSNSDLRARNLRNLVSISVNKKLSKKKIDYLHSVVSNALESLLPVEFDGEKLLTMVQEIFNPVKESYKFEDIETIPLNQMMMSGTKISLSKDEDLLKDNISIDDIFEKDGVFRIQNTHVKTFTTESFPRNTSLQEVQGAIFDPLGRHYQITLPCRFIATITIAFDNVKKDAKWQSSKAGWNIGSLAYLSATVEDKKPEIKLRREEYRSIVEAIEEYREFPLRAMISYTLIDEDRHKLDTYGELLKNRFEDLSSGSWILKEESKPMVSFLSLVYSLPGHYSKTFKNKFHRFKMLFKVNNSKIIPLYSDFKGFGKPTMLLFGRTGQMQTLSMHPCDTNSNFSLVGPPGTGKSTLLNELIMSSLDTGDVIRSIDLGNSQKRTCELAGGQYEEFSAESKKCLNFFTNIRTEFITDDGGVEMEVVAAEELITIIPMIGKMAGVSVYTESDKLSGVTEQLKEKQLQIFLENAVQIAYDREGRQAGMQEVYEALLDISNRYNNSKHEELASLAYGIAVAIEDYVRVDLGGERFKQGKYFEYYNGANNLEINKDYFLLEMEAIKKKSAEFATIVTMGVLQKMAEEAYSRQDVFKWYLIDEASDPLKDFLFVKFLDNFGLRIRKYGGGVGIITQFLRHFFVNNEAKSLFDAMSFKIFLEQDKENIEQAVNSGKVSLNDFQEALMKSVKKRGNEYSELMVLHRGQTMISRLKLDPYSAWLFRSDMDGKKKIKEVRNAYNLGELEAVEFLVNAQENPELDAQENLALVQSRGESGTV